MRRLLTALAAGLLALPLVAAAGPTGPTGTASTQMTVVELRIDGLDPIVAVDGRTAATTIGAPLATTDAVALTALGSDHAPARTRSDGRTEDETESITVGSPALGVVGVMNPIRARSVVDGGQVVASLAAATTTWVVDLSELAGGLTTRIDSANATSVVSDAAAAAEQGVTVSNIGLRLGGLIDVLGELPLDTILALVDELGLPLDVDAAATIAELDAALTAVLADVEDVQQLVAAFGDETAGPVGEHVAATTALAAAQTQLAAAQVDRASLLADLSTAQGGQPDVATLQAAHDAVSGAATVADVLLALASGPPVPDAAACGVDITDALGDAAAAARTCIADAMEPLVAPFLTAGTDFDAAVGAAQLAAAIARMQGEVAALDTLIASLQASITTLTDVTLPALEATIAALVDQLTALIADELATAVAALDEVLATGDLAALVDALLEAIDTLDQTSLLSVEQLDVDVDAIAGTTLADTSATIGCTVEMSVLGRTVGPQGCEAGLDPLLAAAETLDAAIAEVRDVLAALPLTAGDLSQVELELLADATDPAVCPGGAAYARTCEVDGTTHATAGIRVLDLTLPSLTIDPAAAPSDLTDLVAGLADLDVIADVDAAVADVTALLADVGLAGLAGSLPSGSDVLGPAATAVAEAVSPVTTVLDASGVGSLVDPVSTPGIQLVVDPVSAASFTSGAPTAPTAAGDPGSPDEPSGAPTPSTPDLPSTGGGGALLGLAAIGSALALRRRRD